MFQNRLVCWLVKEWGLLYHLPCHWWVGSHLDDSTLLHSLCTRLEETIHRVSNQWTPVWSCRGWYQWGFLCHTQWWLLLAVSATLCVLCSFISSCCYCSDGSNALDGTNDANACTRSATVVLIILIIIIVCIVPATADPAAQGEEDHYCSVMTLSSILSHSQPMGPAAEAAIIIHSSYGSSCSPASSRSPTPSGSVLGEWLPWWQYDGMLFAQVAPPPPPPSSPPSQAPPPPPPMWWLCTCTTNWSSVNIFFVLIIIIMAISKLHSCCC